ncbi:MAG: RecQ family ATP-dependent DNA helicase [Flavobacteriaceae bacterium]
MIQEPIDILRKHWGHQDFRGSQREIIEAVLAGQDVLTLMPTAAGKSLCYQIPGLIKDGICVVISPLIALIQDQVNQLKKRDIKAIALTAGLSQDELIKQLDNCIYGKYKFLYLSPERLQQTLIQERLAEMPVSLWAIDEVHCISQWGHDFRPAYLECGVLRDLKPDVNMIALTATATKPVVKDISEQLRFQNYRTFQDSFQRPNISYSVLADEDKNKRLYSLCKTVKKSGIVYTRTRRSTVEISAYLNKKGITSTYYHGGMSREDKDTKLRSWMSNKLKIIVATNAFGMGVDKPDVELVVHYQIPDCLENYFQEAGRVGRDGSVAQAVLIYDPSDHQKAKAQFLDALPDTAFLKLLYRKLNNYFQISYGEGKDQTFQFNFNAFCEVYKLNSSLVYSGLRIMDQHSVLTLSQHFQRRTQLKFAVGKNVLMKYLEKNRDIAILVQNLLRTYGGVFDFETKINIRLIAKKSAVSESEVVKALERLEKDSIISYQAGHTDLEITMLVPREDDTTIYGFAPKLKALRRLKSEKLNRMFAYIENTRQCRSKQLLKYFGENLRQNCGLCDVCLEKAYDPDSNDETIRKNILAALEGHAYTSRQLIDHFSYNEHQLLTTLQGLLEDQLIVVNSKNEYVKS